jgi:hypothetical protein
VKTASVLERRGAAIAGPRWPALYEAGQDDIAPGLQRIAQASQLPFERYSHRQSPMTVGFTNAAG